MPDDEPFALESPPASDRQRVVADIRRRHAERDRVARRELDHEEFRLRAFFVVESVGHDLAEVFDPRDGHTLESVVATLAARVGAAGSSTEASVRWWAGRDLTVTHGGRIVAVVRRARGGPPVVQVDV